MNFPLCEAEEGPPPMWVVVSQHQKGFLCTHARRQHISYYPVAVIKCPSEGHYGSKGLFWFTVQTMVHHWVREGAMAARI